MAGKLCYYEGCHDVAEIKGLCLGHYNLWLKNVKHIPKNSHWSLAERFWHYVWKPFDKGCWFWHGALNRAGYGRLRMNGVTIEAHRASWMLHYGDIPKNMCVLHKCDNRSCIKPKHLWLGTQADNLKDMVVKRRSLYGEKATGVKLMENDVLEIRRQVRLPFLTNRNIAKVFEVDESLVSSIKCYKVWNYPEILKREQDARNFRNSI